MTSLFELSDKTLNRLLDQAVALEKAQADLAVAIDALNWIASWREGEEVRGSFDEPWSARTARQALARLRVPKP